MGKLKHNYHKQPQKHNGKPKKGGYKAWLHTRHKIRKGLVR